MKKNGLALSSMVVALIALAGCQATGENYAANVYKAGQVNARQNAKTVNILAVMPAKIEVDNTQAKQSAQIFGAVLGAVAGGVVGHNVGSGRAPNTAIGAVGGGVVGAAAGSLVKDTTLVDGVSITYVEEGQTFNSAQVGRSCEFSPGMAVVVSTDANETRIQPNATCPVETKG
ncbi:outer membrane lipoprotein SlyB [Pseudomonas duriflava]|uniref:Outer membrane lipoprotein SlyB n=1 Tax=Pseudomonas duriflava TaxID=459528 RepID=A0A562QL69_9PSED|nr:glycine zipper 2TM domain-containing protein [Pseudomonas duriflava]TWI57497.1 outer membrane lipoprotein SlyB [Pseudomonas duriflava]